MRIFTALSIPASGQELLYRQTDTLRKAFPRLKWVTMDSLHITLEFFGEVSPRRVREAAVALESAVFDTPSFRITVQGIGTFPERGPARVIYARIGEGQEKCKKLYRESAAAFRGIVSAQGGGYVPHITLARVRRGASRQPSGRKRTDLSGGMLINRVVLFQSITEAHGARYVKIAEKILKTP